MATMIQKWQATDGSEWSTEKQAAERDALVIAVNCAMKPLGDLPKNDGCKFANGGGYIQHTQQAIDDVRRRLHEIAAAGPLKWWFDIQKTRHGKTDEDLMRCHPSWQCRMLDGDHEPLDKAYSRLCCIDFATCREYGQPYYANNPAEAEQFEVNR